MLQNLAEKTSVIIKQFVINKNVDKLSLNIIFTCAVYCLTYLLYFFSFYDAVSMPIYMAILLAIFVAVTIYFKKRVGFILPIYSIAVYFFLDCQSYMMKNEFFHGYVFAAITYYLKWKSIFVVLIIYLLLKIVNNKTGIELEKSKTLSRGNKYVYDFFAVFLMMGSLVFGEMIYVIDVITAYKLPQFVLWMIVLAGLFIVLCASYGWYKRFDANILLGLLPLPYIYKSFGYIIVNENFKETLTAVWIWLEAMGYKSI